MEFTFDRLIGVGGLLLGAVGIILGLTTSKWILGSVLILLAIAVPLAVFLTNRRYATMSPFTVLESKKSVVIHDVSGKTATLRKELLLRSNFNGLEFFTHRNISSDGMISAFRNEFGSSMPELVVRRDAGAWEVSTYFPSKLAKGQQKKTWLEFDLTDAYIHSHERSKTMVDGSYKYICVSVESVQRPFIDASCTKYFSGLPVKSIAVKFNQQHTKLEVEIRKPKRGAIYQVEWTW